MRFSRISSQSRIIFKQRRFTKFCFSKLSVLDSTFWSGKDSLTWFTSSMMKSHKVPPHSLTKQSHFQAEKIHYILFQRVESPWLNLLKRQRFVKMIHELNNEISWRSFAWAHKAKSVSSREDSPILFQQVESPWLTLLMRQRFVAMFHERSETTLWGSLASA